MHSVTFITCASKLLKHDINDTLSFTYMLSTTPQTCDSKARLLSSDLQLGTNFRVHQHQSLEPKSRTKVPSQRHCKIIIINQNIKAPEVKQHSNHIVIHHLPPSEKLILKENIHLVQNKINRYSPPYLFVSLCYGVRI